jgi:hypothetical protein
MIPFALLGAVLPGHPFDGLYYDEGATCLKHTTTLAISKSGERGAEQSAATR